MPTTQIHVGDALEVLKTLPDESVNCCVTSPPYFGLRNYQVDRQIGLEPTPDEYVSNLVDVFREVRRVLRGDGTLWLNLGDSYASQGGPEPAQTKWQVQGASDTQNGGKSRSPGTLKPKDLIGIPWMVAFALRADGWWLRSDIIWCLSGGTWLYTKTQKGEMPMTVKDIARLDPSTVQLWNGDKWTQLLGMSQNDRKGDEVELVLRSGERISCTPTHRFPTNRGIISAGEIVVGDILQSCRLPEPDEPKDCALDVDAAWFAGLYIAEGSRSGNTIQIAGHIKETARKERLQAIAKKYGGSMTFDECGNSLNIRMYGKVLNAVIDELVNGTSAHTKSFAPVVWRYSNQFLAAMIDGYLSGDGHKDGNRWRLGFCRNYNLERDLRTACARLGYTLTLKLSSVSYNGARVPTFRGELRKGRSGHHNEKDRNEVVGIRNSRCRVVWDLGVADEPHLFALTSGVLTHNSKPNPMPESIKDRPTKSHEYVFLMSKSQRYWYDADAIAELSVTGDVRTPYGSDGAWAMDGRNKWDEGKGQPRKGADGKKRNKRDVWTVATQPYSEAHFATMPPALVEPCVKAGCPGDGVVLDPFFGAGTTGLMANRLGRNCIGIELNPQYAEMAHRRVENDAPLMNRVERISDMEQGG